MKHSIQLTALCAALALAGCGGGGGFYGASSSSSTGSSTGTGGTTSATVAVPSTIAVSQSKATFSTGGDSVTLTFRVLDANGGVILGAPITLVIPNIGQTGASLSTTSSIKTDPTTGLATTTLTLANDNTNIDFGINHNIALTVTSTQGGGTATQKVIIPVTGTKLSLSTDISIVGTGSSANVSATALDGAGQPLVGATVNFLNSSGTVVGTAKTGSNGIATLAVSSTTIGSAGLTLTAQLVGSVSTITQSSTNNVVLSVQNQNLFFTSLPTTATIINASAAIAVKVNAATQSALPSTISLSTSLGTFGASGTTVGSINAPVSGVVQNSDGTWSGVATATLTSSSPGTATIAASAGTNSIRGTTSFISTIPQNATLQSGSSVLTPHSTTQVIAMVTDSNGAPVTGAVVNFSISNDPSGGSLSAPLATTDSSGQATVTYTAGATATANNAVKINATATSSNGSVTVSANSGLPLTLTVAGQSAYITISQDNLVVVDATDPTNYYKNFSESVVDINGNPIVTQPVSVALIPQSYSKGYSVWDATNNVWIQIVTVTCPAVATGSTFVNPVSLLSGSTSGSSGSFVTGPQGTFAYKIRYGKNYAGWVTLNMNASTVVGTNQTVTALSLIPPVLSTDITNKLVPPPNQVSPFNPTPKASDYDPTTASGYSASYLTALKSCP